jgi:hypothetical protein
MKHFIAKEKGIGLTGEKRGGWMKLAQALARALRALYLARRISALKRKKAALALRAA